MLTGLKVSSLASKCVYFTDQNIMQRWNSVELNFEGLEMQKQNTPTHRAQRADEKNGVICLGIMFVSRIMVIKMSKMTHFLYFLLMKAKNKSKFGKNI